MKRRRLIVLACALVATFAVAACGSSKNTSSSANGPTPTGSSSGSSASGSPVKIGIFTDAGSAVSYPLIGPGAEAGADFINAHGGLAGHKVVVDQCNAGVDPNLTSQCARKLVQDGDVAIAGQEALSDASATPVLDAAKIPQVAVEPRAPQTLTSPYDFETGAPAQVMYAVDAAYAVKKMHQKIAILVQQSTAGLGFAQLLSSVLKGYGIPIAGTIEASPTAPAYAPFVGTAQSDKANAILALVPAAQLKQFINAAQAANAKFSYYEEFPYGAADVGTGNLDSQVSVEPLPIVNPSATSGVMGDFVAAMKAVGSPVQSNSNGNEAFQAFWGYYVIWQLVKQEHLTTITAASLDSALNSAKNLQLGGVIPPWTPSAKASAALAKIAFTPRVSNSSMWVNGYKNGQPVLLQPNEVSALSALGGNFGS